MDSAFEQCLNALKHSQKILLLTSLYPTREELFGAMLLAVALEHLHKSVTTVIADEFAKIFPETLPRPLGGTTTLADETVIAIELANRSAGALRYEQEGETLRIYLELSGENLTHQDLALSRTAADGFDSTLVLGAPRIDLVRDHEALEALLAETTLINIDADPANEGFGDINVLGSGEPLAVVLALAERFPGLPDSFKEWRAALLQAPLPTQALRLFGRLLARLTEEKGWNVTALSGEDFSRSGYALERFAAEIGRFPFRAPFFPKPLAVLWQDQGGVKGLLVAPDKSAYQRLAKSVPGRYGVDGYALHFQGDDLENAKRRLLEMIGA